jgi:hypothetical protein
LSGLGSTRVVGFCRPAGRQSAAVGVGLTKFPSDVPGCPLAVVVDVTAALASDDSPAMNSRLRIRESSPCISEPIAADVVKEPRFALAALHSLVMAHHVRRLCNAAQILVP